MVEMKLNWINYMVILRQFTEPSDGICITRRVPDIEIIWINYNQHDYWNDNTIEYLYNDNKIRYYDISLYIGKWLKDEFETPNEKCMKWNSINLFILSTNGRNIIRYKC